jgi:hypothetical protein
MTLLDRFRTVPRHKHPDPGVRLAHVAEVPLTERALIESIAREDEDARVRRAAVAKLMDPAALGRIVREDADEGVRAAAAGMLRDIALDVFEGVGEAEGLDAVDSLDDVPMLAQVAKSSGREIVALRALARIGDTRQLGSIARHATIESVRRGALDLVHERGETGEIFAVAMHAEHKDTATEAVDLVGRAGRSSLEQIAARGRSKAAVKRARALLREMDEAADPAPPAPEETDAAARARLAAEEQAAVRDSEARAKAARELAEREEAARQAAEARAEAERLAAERQRAQRLSRLVELADEMERAGAESDLHAARKRMITLRREWTSAVGDAGNPAELGELLERGGAIVAAWESREHEAREADLRVRREALARLQNLIRRVDALAEKPDLSSRVVERALRDIRAAVADVPPLPSKQDFLDITQRLKTAQSNLQPKLQELRDAEGWQRWANATIQEQLCSKMEALESVGDPETIAREVKALQQQWRQAADVPRAQADALWRRFKAAHDIVWAKCEAYFAARAESFKENLARKVALCEKAESLVDSSSWLQTAEEIKRLQAEWKTIGPVPHGQEKAIWERFRTPCDRFFTRRNEDLARRKAVWAENLARKSAICERAEQLMSSTDWDPTAAELKQLQAQWKTIGPVKKSRSEAIWQRFRAACDQFFTNYAHRHEAARVERAASWDGVCAEMEQLAAAGPADGGQSDFLARVRALHSRWKQESGARASSPDSRALEERFAGAFAQVSEKWPEAVRGTDMDPEANRARMEALVTRMEELARSVAGTTGGADEALSPTVRLAAMLKEALASNTIGGGVDEQSRRTATVEEVRQAQASWVRIGPVPDAIRLPLQDRFQRAGRFIIDKVGRPKPVKGRDTGPAKAGPHAPPRT